MLLLGVVPELAASALLLVDLLHPSSGEPPDARWVRGRLRHGGFKVARIDEHENLAYDGRPLLLDPEVLAVGRKAEPERGDPGHDLALPGPRPPAPVDLPGYLPTLLLADEVAHADCDGVTGVVEGGDPGAHSAEVSFVAPPVLDVAKPAVAPGGEGNVYLALLSELLYAPEAGARRIGTGEPLVPDHLHELPVSQAYLNAELALLVVETVAVAALLF